MNLDLRLPLGLLFTLLGMVLVIHGLTVGALVLDLNVNLVWGVVMAVFGGILIYVARMNTTR